MIYDLDLKQPGLKKLLRSKGIENNALVASILIGHTAIYQAQGVVDFRTLGWTILPLPWSSSFDPKTYHAVYGARARVVALLTRRWSGRAHVNTTRILL